MVGLGWRMMKPILPQPYAFPTPQTRLTRSLETTPFPTAEELLRALRRLPAAVGVVRGGPAFSFLPPLLSCFSRSWGPTEVAAAAGVRPGSYVLGRGLGVGVWGPGGRDGPGQ